MDEPQRWTCECGYSEVMVEDDARVDLAAWARHVREAHGDDVLADTLRAAVEERVEELTREGTIMEDPFTGHRHWMADPPEKP